MIEDIRFWRRQAACMAILVLVLVLGTTIDAAPHWAAAGIAVLYAVVCLVLAGITAWQDRRGDHDDPSTSTTIWLYRD